MRENATREEIVKAGDRLFYEKGFESTSFSDISKDVGISRGNITFHFPSKDEILAAVIDLRMERIGQMLKRWEAESESSQDRIKCFINIVITNRAKIFLYGCPVGTLTSELAKLDHAAMPHAKRLFAVFQDWLRSQFLQIGCASRAEADSLAMHVLAWSQGIATLAQAFGDEKFVRREVRQLEDWLDTAVIPHGKRRNRGVKRQSLASGSR